MRIIHVGMALLLLFAVGCSDHAGSDGKSASHPLSLIEKKRIELQQAYLVKPDRRVFLALEDIAGLTSSTLQKIDYAWIKGEWRISLGGREVGKLPKYPSFGDSMAFLESWCKTSIKETSFRASADDSTSSTVWLEKCLDRFYAPYLLAGLNLLDFEWARGVRDPRQIALGARAAVYLAAQTIDETEVADEIFARAWALLAFSKAMGTESFASEAALLAWKMKYTKEARQMAQALPAQDPVRLYLLKNAEEIRAAADEATTSALAKWLIWSRLEPEDLKERRYEDPKAALPFLGLLSSKSCYATKELASHRYIIEIIREITAWKTPDARMGRIDPRDYMKKFDEASKRLLIPAPGPFLNSREIKLYYSAAFYTSLFGLGVHNLDTWASWETTVEFNKALNPAKTDAMALDFAQWYNTLAQSAIAKGNSKAFAKDIGGLQSFGFPLIGQSLKTGASYIRNDATGQWKVYRQAVARMDTRPLHRWWLGYLGKDYLYDPAFAEEGYNAYFQAEELSNSRFFKFHKNYCSDDDRPATPSLHKRDYGADLVYKRYFQNRPEDYNEVTDICEALSDAGQYGRAREVLQDWLRSPMGADPPVNFSPVVHAKIDLAEGRYEDALKAIKKAPYHNVEWIEQIKTVALMHLRRYDEAEEAAKKSMLRYPDSASSLGNIMELYWRMGRADDAADLLKAYPFTLSSGDVMRKLGKAFMSAFKDDAPRAIQAAEALLNRKIDRNLIAYLGNTAMQESNWRIGYEVYSRLDVGGNDRFRNRVNAYKALCALEGREKALKWLESLEYDSKKRDIIFVFAYWDSAYDLLWDLSPIDQDEASSDYLWLLRAAAHVREGQKDKKHEAALLKYYRRSKGIYYYQAGRYLMGLINEEQVIHLDVNQKGVMELAYFLGAKSEVQGRLREAVGWYRLAVESAPKYDGEYEWALRGLYRFYADGKGITILEKRWKKAHAVRMGESAKPPAKP